MKKILLPLCMAIVLAACTDGDDPTPAACQPTEVEYFNQNSTFFYFSKEHKGLKLLSSVEVAANTDSSFTYSYDYIEDRLSKISVTEEGVTVNFTPTFDGDKLTKLSGKPFGVGIVYYEIDLEYSGNNISQWARSIADPTTGTLYKIQDYSFTYDGENITSYTFSYDFDAISNWLNSTPPGPYTPTAIFTNEYDYGTDPAPNPLYLQFNLHNPELSLLANLPISIVQKTPDGLLSGSRGYEITLNEQGFPTYADSGDTFFDITYDCK